jgi:hypothetical protein
MRLPRRPAPPAAAPLLLAAVLLPAAPLAAPPERLEVTLSAAAPAAPAARELVAEALFLADTLPPGGRDVNLSLGLAEGEPDPITGRAEVVASPRAQLALALAPRIGFTADVGLATEGDVALDAPGASLKLLLRDPRGGARTGLSASIDLFGSTRSLDETEGGLGLGVIRAVGPVALRAAAAIASGVRTWTPHLHTGASAALAVGTHVRALVEAVAELQGGEVDLAAGPMLKVALGGSTSLMAGALFDVSRDAGLPTFLFQLTRSM